MSIVKLVCFLVHARNAGPTAILIDDVPMDDAVGALRPAANGLTCLYGPTDITAELSHRRKDAMSKGLDLLKIEIMVDVGVAKGHKLSLAEVAGHRVIHLRRLREDVRDRIVAPYWWAFCEKVGRRGPFDPLALSQPGFVGYLHDQPEFAHLDVIEYFIRDPRGMRQVATLFSDRHVLGVEAVGMSGIRLALPDSIREALKPPTMPIAGLITSA